MNGSEMKRYISLPDLPPVHSFHFTEGCLSTVKSGLVKLAFGATVCPVANIMVQFPPLNCSCTLILVLIFFVFFLCSVSFFLSSLATSRIDSHANYFRSTVDSHKAQRSPLRNMLHLPGNTLQIPHRPRSPEARDRTQTSKSNANTTANSHAVPFNNTGLAHLR